MCPKTLYIRWSVHYIFKTKLMEQIRTYAQTRTPNLFDGPIDEEPPLKIGTEVFDCTMPSELEFDDEAPSEKVQNSKGEFSIFQNKLEEDRKPQGNSEDKVESEQAPTSKKESQYQMLTRSIVTFAFQKNGSVIFGKPQYAINSYIPHFLKVKTFPVKFKDDAAQLSKGVSAFKLFWKNVVGYVKVEIFISTNTIYLLERKVQGLLVKAAWSLGDLFKVFSDRQEKKARLIFRVTQGNEIKIITRELQEVDLNLLASLLAEAGSSFNITSTV